jgi:hypothetical protein
MKITGRDVKFFLLGVLTIFIIDTIMDWEGAKKSFKDGYNNAISSSPKIESENN